MLQRPSSEHSVEVAFFCIKRNESCHHSRYPVQTSRSAIIYYLSFITRDCSFDKAEAAWDQLVNRGWDDGDEKLWVNGKREGGGGWKQLLA
jgi:hypothetical protein